MRVGVAARLSNCGDSLRASTTASAWKHRGGHQGNDLGYGNNVEDWVIRSQVLTASRRLWMLFNDYMAVGLGLVPELKIESVRPERGLDEERFNRPGASRCLLLNSHGNIRTTGMKLIMSQSAVPSVG